MSGSPTLSDTPASVTAARAVAHVARLVAVLSVAVQAALVAIEISWVLEGRLSFGDVAGDKGFPLALSVAGALAVWWLSARVLASTRTAPGAPSRWS